MEIIISNNRVWLDGEEAVVDKQTETVTVEHDLWGKVEGVVKNSTGNWEKDGVLYTLHNDWREVKPKKWVSYASQAFVNSDRQWRNLKVWFEEDMHATVFTLPPDYRWKTVEIEKEVEGDI